MTTTRHLALGLALALLAACGGTSTPPTEDTNVWLCDSSCVLPGRCVAIQGGGAMSCAQVVGWSPIPSGSCPSPDCTAVVNPTNACMAVVSCPVR